MHPAFPVAEGKPAYSNPAHDPEEGEDVVECSKCVAAKRKCSGTFPCARCVKLDAADGCVSAQQFF